MTGIKYLFCLLTTTLLFGRVNAQQDGADHKQGPLKIRKTWAIIVGVAKFEQSNQFGNLAYADSDAVAFKDFLLDQKDKIHISEDQIFFFMDSNAVDTSIRSALYKVSFLATNEDQVIFYFSGHGGKNKKDNYLIAGNYKDPMYLKAGMLQMKEIWDYFKDYIAQEGVGVNNVRRAILIIDACSAGSLDDLEKGFDDSKLLRIYSSYPDKKSVEMNDYKSGLFTHFLINGLKGDADTGGSGYVTPFGLRRYLEDSIYVRHNKVQMPEVKGGKEEMVIFEYDPARRRLERELENSKPHVPHGVKPVNIMVIKGMPDKPDHHSEDFKKFTYYVKQNQLLFGASQQDTLNCARYYFERLAIDPDFREKMIDARLMFLNALQKKNAVLFDFYMTQGRFYFDQQTTRIAVNEMTYALQLTRLNDRMYNYLRPRALFMQSMALNDPSRAADLLRSALAVDSTAVYAQVGLASRLIDAGQPDSALLYLEKARKAASDWPLAHLKTGMAYEALQKPELARPYFETTIKLNPRDAYAYYQYGMNRYNGKQFAPAIEAMNKACKLEPKDRSYLETLAFFYYVSKDDDNARIAYQKLLMLDPQNNEARVTLAKIANRHADYEDAARQMKAAIARDSTKTGYYIYLGNTFAQAKKYDEALDNYRSALSLDPQNKEALNALSRLSLNNGDAVNKKLHYWLFSDKLSSGYFPNGRKVKEILNEGLLLFSERKDTAALASFTAVLEIDSLNFLALEYSGMILQSQSRPADALPYYQRLARLNPGKPDYRFTLSKIFNSLNQKEPAIRELERGLQKDSLRSEEWESLGIINYELSRYPSALTGFVKASRLTGDSVATYLFNTALTYGQLKLHDQAINWYLKSIDRDSTDTRTLRELGEQYNLSGDYEKALFYLDKVVKRTPGDHQAYAALGDAYFGLGKDTVALASYQQAMKLSPDDADYWIGVGRGFEETGDAENAIRIYKKALAKVPGDTWLSYDIGHIYYIKNKNAEAIPYFKRAIAGDSTNADAMTDLAGIYIAQYSEPKVNAAKLRQFVLPLYLKAFKADSTFLKALMGLSHTYDLLKEEDKSNFYLEKAAIADTTDAFTVTTLANLRYNQGRKDEAIALYEKAARHESDYASTYFNLGRLYADHREDYDKALQAYAKARQLDSKMEDLDYQTALAYENKEQYPAAISSLKKAAKQMPQNPLIYLSMGNIYAEVGNLEAASENYLKASILNPNDYSAPMRLGNISYRKGKYQQALTHYQAAARLLGNSKAFEPEFINCYTGLRNFPAAIKLARQLHERTKKAGDLFTLTSLYIRTGQRALALKILNDSIATWPKNEAYLIQLGRMREAEKDDKQAEAYYRRAAKINAFEGNFHLGLLFAEKDSAKAVDAYLAAVAADSTETSPLYNIAGIAYSGNNMKMALKYIKLRIERRPDVIGYALKAEIYASLKDTAEVIRARQQALLLRDDVETERALGMAYYDYDVYDKGLKCLENAYQLYPAAYKDYTELAYLYMMTKKYPQAIRWYNKALKPGSMEAISMTNLAYCYLRNRPRSLTEAERLLKAALRIKPSYYSTNSYLMYIYAETGRTADAIELLKNIRKNSVDIENDLRTSVDFSSLRKNRGFMNALNQK